MGALGPNARSSSVAARRFIAPHSSTSSRPAVIDRIMWSASFAAAMPPRRRAEEPLGAAAADWRRIAVAGGDEALALQALQRDEHGRTRDLAAGPLFDGVPNRDRIGLVAQARAPRAGRRARTRGSPETQVIAEAFEYLNYYLTDVRPFVKPEKPERRQFPEASRGSGRSHVCRLHVCSHSRQRLS